MTAQCQRVLDRLKQGPATSWQLMQDAQVCCPTKRISELRRAGFRIESSEQHRGKSRIVTYCLKP